MDAPTNDHLAPNAERLECFADDLEREGRTDLAEMVRRAARSLREESQRQPSEATASAGRFFLGVALTGEARRALRRHLEAVEMPGRLARSEDWHITLHFLGKTSPEALETLRESLGTADLGRPFKVVLGRLGAFPAPERAGVLWLGVEEGAPALAALAARVESCARKAGFPAETRPYTPHVTLSRLRPPADVRRLVERVPALHERVAVDAVVLFRSGLGGGSGR